MRRSCLSALLALLLLSGCAAPHTDPSADPTPSASQCPPASDFGYTPDQLPAPESDPGQWALTDFPGCLESSAPVRCEDYPLLEGTELENSVQVLRGQEDGPVIYIVAGVHGDEQAGWRAGNLLKETGLTAGTLYILSPANSYGAQNDQRTTKSGRDLNRSFPGDPAGWDAQKLAAAIYADIEEKQPDLVLDLHEARAQQGQRDALGNSVIAQSLDGVGDLVLDLLLKSEAGSLCSGPITLYGSPPEGSLNQTVTLRLGIPVLTVETYREEPLAQRVRNHLELTQYILTQYGMR